MALSAISLGLRGTWGLRSWVEPDPVTAQVMKTSRVGFNGMSTFLCCCGARARRPGFGCNKDQRRWNHKVLPRETPGQGGGAEPMRAGSGAGRGVRARRPFESGARGPIGAGWMTTCFSDLPARAFAAGSGSG
ncbi:hypothetical protein GCM10011324_26080 [Allosediminivita pacifica]|nr:hypothetical protein GCM10011324_26080 [Allosediminivita pacifica]